MTNPTPQKPPLQFIDDLIQMPAKTLLYRGLKFSRSSLHRLGRAGEIKTAAIRFSGSTQRRRVILRESLDAFIDRQIADAVEPREESDTASA
jgi:hypothetical protein